MKEKIVLDEGDIAVLDMIEDPVVFGEFVRSTDEEIESGGSWRFNNYQKLMILDESPYVSVCTGRTTGKTVSLETKIVHNAVSNKYRKASANEVVLVVQNKSQLEPVFLRLTQFFRRHPFLKHFVDRTSINFSEHLIKLLNGAIVRCRIVGSSADSNIIGLHTPCILVDEAQVFNYVAWNCLDGDTLVMSSNGSTKIKDLVEGDCVFTYIPGVGLRITKVDKCFSRTVNKLITIKTDSDDTIKCTPEHRLWCTKNHNFKFIAAGELSVGDKIKSVHNVNNDIYYQPTVSEFIYGTLLGDGHLEKLAHGSRYKQVHSYNQNAYVDFKYNIVKDFVTAPPKIMKNCGHGNSSYCFNTVSNTLFDDIYSLTYINKRKCVTREWLDKLTPFSLAVWYMDDGSLSHNRRVTLATCSFSGDEVDLILDYFKSKYGIEFTYEHNGIISCNTANSKRFLDLVSSYVIPSMKYKTLLTFNSTITDIVTTAGIFDVYDIEVESEEHKFIANNIVSSNSLGQCLTQWDEGFQMWISGVPNGLREKNILYEADNLDEKWSRYNVSRLQSPRYTEDQNKSDLKQYGGAEGDDYIHLVLGEHGVPAFSVFDRKLMKIESYDVVLGMLNNLTLEQAGGKFYEVLKAPDIISAKPDLIACAVDAGFSNDPTIITILYRQDSLWRIFLRYELRRIKYPMQAKIINWLDNIYGFNMITLDAGSSGLALGQMLQDLDEFKGKDYQKRLTLVDFQGGVVVDYNEDGKEVKDRVRKFTIQTLQKWSQNDQIIVFSDRDDEMLSELERVGFTRDMLGQPKYFVYSPMGGQRGDDHILASLLTWVYGYYYEYYSPEKPKTKGKYSDLARGGWNTR